MLNWLRNYLSDRKQFCVVNNHQSDILPISIGVPQGSVLGPLLFLIYMNDVSSISDLIKLFADDTNIFISANNKEEMETKGNNLLSEISDWIIANRLTININKTCYTIFHKNKKKKYKINISLLNTPIQQVQCTKYLDLNIDDQLT